MAPKFRGIFSAVDLVPTEFGILSVASVTEHTANDEDFVRGYAIEFDTRPTVRLLEKFASTPAATLSDGTGLARYDDVHPFFIEVEDYHSTFDLTGEDRFARVTKQLNAATQKAVERELLNGHAARVEGTSNRYLTQLGSYNLPDTQPDTGLSVLRGLAVLEDAMSNSPIGEQGVIHMTRGMAASLGVNYLRIVPDGKGIPHVQTANGTNVCIGAGYNGDGPFSIVTTKALTSNIATITTTTPHLLKAGDTVEVSGVDATFNGTYTVSNVGSTTSFSYAKTHADVSSASSGGLVQMKGTSNTKWIYATGALEVHLGATEVVNETLAQGYDVTTNQNNMRIKALRPAAVHFDPSIHYAVKIDMTKTA